jgi:hypothetical protein
MHHAMKMYVGEEVQFQSLTSALDLGGWLASGSGRLTPGIYLIGDRWALNPVWTLWRRQNFWKNVIFWDVAPCSSCVNQRFGGTYRLHRQGRKIGARGTSVSRWLQIVGSHKNYTASHPRRRHSSQSPLWKPQILQKLLCESKTKPQSPIVKFVVQMLYRDIPARLMYRLCNWCDNSLGKRINCL